MRLGIDDKHAILTVKYDEHLHSDTHRSGVKAGQWATFKAETALDPLWEALGEEREAEMILTQRDFNKKEKADERKSSAALAVESYLDKCLTFSYLAFTGYGGGEKVLKKRLMNDNPRKFNLDEQLRVPYECCSHPMTQWQLARYGIKEG